MLLDPGFPDPRAAEPHGLLAVGGDYRADILLEAYERGIFPWPSEELPFAWFSPDPRMVLLPEDLRVSRSLRRTIRQRAFELRFDTAFADVARKCARAPRPGQEGTWIRPELREGFEELHRLGHAHSLEAWRDGRLVGGLYGLAIGSAFCGESMFFEEPDASKVAFVGLVSTLHAWGFDLIDCQVHTPHLERFGAVEWPRDLFLDALAEARTRRIRPGSWAGSTVRTTPPRVSDAEIARRRRNVGRRREAERLDRERPATPAWDVAAANADSFPPADDVDPDEALLAWLARMRRMLASAPLLGSVTEERDEAGGVRAPYRDDPGRKPI